MTKPLPTVAAIGVILIGLSACSPRAERLLFDGSYYPVKERGISKEDRNAFEVSVRRADQGLDGARAAGLHGGVKYCIKNFGTSEIDWARGPLDEEETLQISNGNLVFQGRCVTW